ncbi:uncharacterized protein Dana_GF27103, isoform B [Drosophila ananassae]|uniref:Uncharacterized protein, isoform B n=1 Tax=Drosophila ananassae TaxID=7217 RepID=A0A0P9ALI3_DROAN|nr:uncharacterized protein Dana_GF27103, isoform B [Drosophila ananassae]
MCFCPTIGLKITVILLVAISATLNCLDFIEDFYNILNIGSNVILLSVSMTIDLVCIGFAFAGVYALYFEKIRMFQFLLELIAYCLCKLILWIICGNLLGELNTLVTHLWFQLSMLGTLFCMIGTTLLCMRFHEISEEEV